MKLPNLLSFLPRRHTVAMPPVSPFDDDPVPDEDPPVRCCGWFDSSHDLQEGLCVQEHCNADSLARELPLSSWLELQLSGWRVTQAA